MTLKIGHASKDERGKATGGTPGDQTGKEVKVSSWYDGGWGFAARAKDAAVAQRIAAAAEAGCANDRIGYDQSGRNSLMAEAKAVDFDLGKIEKCCECDCSSFASVCVAAALGREFYRGNAPTTRTLKGVLLSTGEFQILEDKNYLTTDAHLRPGDILCNPGRHVVIVLGDGEEKPQLCSVKLPVLKRGSGGAAVSAMQQLLVGSGFSCGPSGVDGDFGGDTDAALRQFQRSRELEADGSCGPLTWAALLGGG